MVILLACGDLRRSESRRCSSSGVSVLVDQAAEDAVAVHSMGFEVVDCGTSPRIDLVAGHRV
jgi:hypothetical protein